MKEAIRLPSFLHAASQFVRISKDAPKYDAVIIDITMSENINNVAHLLSKEMYENIAAHLTPKGVLGVWTQKIIAFFPILAQCS